MSLEQVDGSKNVLEEDKNWEWLDEGEIVDSGCDGFIVHPGGSDSSKLNLGLASYVSWHMGLNEPQMRGTPHCHALPFVLGNDGIYRREPMSDNRMLFMSMHFQSIGDDFKVSCPGEEASTGMSYGKQYF